jgi:K+-transporting ATPase ATPase C chain
MKLIRPAVVLFLLLTIVTGVIYPLVITVAAQAIFPNQANGSLLEKEGKIIGSHLIGQQFDDPKYFWGRPSATTPAYNGASSSGSNLGPTNPDLFKAVSERIDNLKKAHPEQVGAVPMDLVTASASGLDPHISPVAAEYQIERIARERSLPVQEIEKLVRESIEDRTFGLLGEPRVNVLKLNLKLDELKK